ncbi:MAG: hypothetical protein ACF787_08320 [Rhodopirellula sp. JB053]
MQRLSTAVWRRGDQEVPSWRRRPSKTTESRSRMLRRGSTGLTLPDRDGEYPSCPERFRDS